MPVQQASRGAGMPRRAMHIFERFGGVRSSVRTRRLTPARVMWALLNRVGGRGAAWIAGVSIRSNGRRDRACAREKSIILKFFFGPLPEPFCGARRPRWRCRERPVTTSRGRYTRWCMTGMLSTLLARQCRFWRHAAMGTSRAMESPFLASKMANPPMSLQCLQRAILSFSREILHIRSGASETPTAPFRSHLLSDECLNLA